MFIALFLTEVGVTRVADSICFHRCLLEGFGVDQSLAYNLCKKVVKNKQVVN
jgi:hypothetical protein